jgi:hypothetical protein
VLALSRADLRPAREADIAHRAAVVPPPARLLEPYEVAILDQPREPDRLLQRPSLVRVRGQYEPVASRVPSETGARRVLLRLEPADLELEPRQSELLQFSDLRRKIRVVPVVATDRDHRELRAVTSPETPERLPERSADRIPDGGVDAGAGDEPAAPVTQDVERHRPRELPAALDGQGILADQARRDLLVDDPIDLEQV